MQDTANQPLPRLLLVDDEPNILNSLRRLLRPEGFEIMTAENGSQALEVMEQSPADIIVSDMRMPVMTGSEFFKQARERWPDAYRIMLTGFSDNESTIAAVNEGGINAYVNKPWDDVHLLQVVRGGLERKRLVDERNALLELTRKQNQELSFLNEGLEDAVRARTAELKQSATFLELSNKKLKESFHATLCVFSNLVEIRQGNLGGHGKRVADLARKVAVRMGLREQEINDITVAGLLHDIGKIGWTDEMIEKPANVEYTVDERQLAMKHPAIAEKVLMDLDNMKGAAKYIRHHHERFNGQGYPDRLEGVDIPIGARILAVVDDFDELQIGSSGQRRRSQDDAAKLIRDGSGARYDPAVVKVFMKIIGLAEAEVAAGPERKITSAEMKKKMRLARNIIGLDGTMLLSKDYVLDERLIQQLIRYEEKSGVTLDIWVSQG